MTPFWGHAIGVVTVMLMLIFVGIWAWAWLPQHRRAFDELAKLPLEDDAAIARTEGGMAADSSPARAREPGPAPQRTGWRAIE